MEIIIERGRIAKLKELDPYSIAVDGFVAGPEIDAENHRFSFDHHAGCSRFATLASCQQALNAVLLGLDPTPYKIYCNDVDVDVCAAIWCLKNPDRCKEPLVQKLVDAIGKGDMYGGAIDINGMKKTVEWICAPEVESKKNGDYEKLSNDGLKPILESILHRIDSYVNGEAAGEISKQQIISNFKLIRAENNWAFVESNDPHILSKIWQSGFDRVVVARPLEDGTTAYTFAKRSDFIDQFPLQSIYKAVNKLEPGAGGGSSIGGCVRASDGSRSNLKYEQVIQIIDSVLGHCEPIIPKKKIPTKKKPESKKKTTGKLAITKKTS